MLNQPLKDYLVSRVLSRVQMPAQYIGGELNIVRKDYALVAGKLCLAFPDAYTIGMSHHGLQVLYTLMNSRPDWACERVFTPWPDMESELRQAKLPLYSLENFTPLSEFDVLGFSLQYEISSPNVLTMLDLGGVPLRGEQRTMADPLVIGAGAVVDQYQPRAHLCATAADLVGGLFEPGLRAALPAYGAAFRNQAMHRLPFVSGRRQ